MGWFLTMRRVILPQAFRIVLPPYGNTMIMMLKDFLAGSPPPSRSRNWRCRASSSPLSTFKEHHRLHLVAVFYLVMVRSSSWWRTYSERKANSGGAAMIELRDVHKRATASSRVIKGIDATVSGAKLVPA